MGRHVGAERVKRCTSPPRRINRGPHGVVQFDKKSFDGYMNVKAFLESLFGCRVDLVLESTIKPRLRRTILGEAVYAAGL